MTMEPGQYRFADLNSEFEQIRPEHPTSNFQDFMTFLIRLAGVAIGLPLELALLDFSRTNYSSARASMEQAYRRFRIHQRMFANRILKRLYRWRVSKWIKDGTIKQAPPGSALNHRWLGQPWPYLDPVKDAEGSLVAIDAGFTTLTDELMKRGMEFDTWLDTRRGEIEKTRAAEVPTVHSSKTRDAGERPPLPSGDNSDGE